MARLGLETDIVDRDLYRRSIRRFREAGMVLPTFAQLADPRFPRRSRTALAGVDPDAPHPLNLFRVHWFNDADRARAAPTCPATSCCPGRSPASRRASSWRSATASR